MYHITQIYTKYESKIPSSAKCSFQHNNSNNNNNNNVASDHSYIHVQFKVSYKNGQVGCGTVLSSSILRLSSVLHLAIYVENRRGTIFRSNIYSPVNNVLGGQKSPVNNVRGRGHNSPVIMSPLKIPWNRSQCSHFTFPRLYRCAFVGRHYSPGGTIFTSE